MLKSTEQLYIGPCNRPQFPLIIAGSYSENAGYHTYRSAGTQDWLMIGTIDGCGRFEHESGQLFTGAGEIALIRPGVPHDYGVAPQPGAWRLLWAHFHPRSHWNEWLDWPKVSSGLMLLKLVDQVRRHEVFDLFTSVYETATSDRPNREALAMNILEHLLIACADRQSDRSGSATDHRIENIQNYVNGNLAEPISMVKLAEVAHLSISRMGHLFRECTGQTPQQFWEQQRMIRAGQLLDLTDRSVQAVALEVGYDNAYYFSNRFKKLSGTSPTEYRRHQRH